MLGFSKQAFYKWRQCPVTDRDWADAHLINAAIDIHHDDPETGYRFITEEPHYGGIVAGRKRVNRLSNRQRLCSVHSRKRGLGRRPGHRGRTRPPELTRDAGTRSRFPRRRRTPGGLLFNDEPVLTAPEVLTAVFDSD